MIENAEACFQDYIDAGCNHLSVHVEAVKHLHRLLNAIREGGATVGIVLNPATPVEAALEVLSEVDLVLIMSVNPGFGGQSFIPSSLDKLRQARELIHVSGRDIRLQIDGGIKPTNIGDAAAAGADAFVAGTAIFGQNDYAEVISALRTNIAAATDS